MLVEVYVRDLIAITLENAHGRNTTPFSTVYVRLSSQLRALGSLGVTTDKCAAILYPMVESALPEDLFVAWERTRHHHKPDEDGKHKSSEVLLEKLMEFLKHEVEGSTRLLNDLLTITRIRDKFEVHGTVCDVHKGHSGRTRTATSDESSTAVLELFQRSPNKSSRQGARESDVSASSVLRILKRGKYRVYIPRLVQQLNDDDPDRMLQFCEWIQEMVIREPGFMGSIIWSDEAQFKLNGTVNRHNCVYWCEENPHITIEKAVNLPGVNVWCGLSSRGLIGPFRFEGTVTGINYLTMLADSIFPAIRALYGNDDFYFQLDGAPPHYHRDVRAYLDQNLSGQWIGRRGPIEFPARSPDLTPLDFFLWGTVKDGVYKRKPRNLDILWNEIQAVCREISLDVLIRCTESVVTRTQNCIDAAGHQFEQY
ncbi:hypothetical protein LAZ67_10000255 [Cordylochernes scorpioides]|uniref:Transposase n=1 Tax=Cordylochernes scorpioides TaxID=51811 RepID=A0ABY6KWL7_9ARAC|nr:hypothetical protein LAZ67_10000255 [Cordylochernes scorpioides]